MRIYVGNLSYNVSEEDLRQEFAAFGAVESVSLVTDRFSGRPRGFGFVDMPSKEEGEAAIASLNGKMLDYRAVVVNEARARSDSRSGGRSYGDSGGRDSGGGDRSDR